MAAAAASTPSPAPSNNSSEAGHGITGVSSNATTVTALLRMETPSKTLRGLNKPKCIQCGNVARSRCPYQSCKSCCSKAQNPCHIHVLKSQSTFFEKPTSSTPTSELQLAEPSPQAGSHRMSTRQPLQANAYKLLFSATRSKKPLTRKEAVATNEWRLAKLKEHSEKMVDFENDAFDRYMRNVTTLEEIFSSKETNPDEVSVLKQKLRSNPARKENMRSRMKRIVEEGMNEGMEPNSDSKRGRVLWGEKHGGISELMEKMGKVRNEDDLKGCMDLKGQLYGDSENGFEDFVEQRNMVSVEIDQNVIDKINDNWVSLERVGRL